VPRVRAGPDCERDRERAGRGTKGGPAWRQGERGNRRYVDRGEEEVNRRVRASASMRYGQTKNDEPRWGPDGGQKHATGPKAQALRAPSFKRLPLPFSPFSLPAPPPLPPPPLSYSAGTRDTATRARTLRRVHRTSASASASSDARRGTAFSLGLSGRGKTANEEQSGIMKVMQSERMLMYAPANRDLHEYAL